MGTGWRRAFCTTVNHGQDHSDSPDSPRTCLKLAFFSGSNSSTPRLHSAAESSTTPRKCNSSKLSLFKLRSNCGICLESVKRGQGRAIYTAECAHAFHFPCVTSHVRNHRTLLCPVCNAAWHDLNGVVLDTPSLSNKPDFYDDDEPLPNLSAARSFVPETVEFQGFFVNPTPPPPPVVGSTCGTVNQKDFINVELKLLSESALISVCRSHETYATVLRVKAPKPAILLEPAHRAPIDLVCVLDLSEGMTGVKLSMLKRALKFIILSLGSPDRLSIVATTKRLLPLTRMTADGQCAARLITDRLVTGQGTNVGEALRKASKVLEDRRERNSVASVLFLSNGHDEGVQNRTNHRKFPLIQIPVQEAAEDALSKCVGGLLSLVVQDLRVQLSFASGSPPAEITAVYCFTGEQATVLDCSSMRLGDLYAGEDREVLVELRVPSTAVGARHVMSVRSSYKHPATHETYNCTERALLVPVPQPVRSSAPKIERLRNLFITTRAIAESRRLLHHGGDYTSAHRLLASARALIVHSSAITGDDFVRDLEAEMGELQQKVEEHPRRRWSEKEVVVLTDEGGEVLTPMSAWRAAEKLAKVAMMKKSLNRVSDLHGFESARF